MGQEEKHPTNTDGWPGYKKYLTKGYYFAASALAASIIAWLAYM